MSLLRNYLWTVVLLTLVAPQLAGGSSVESASVDSLSPLPSQELRAGGILSVPDGFPLAGATTPTAFTGKPLQLAESTDDAIGADPWDSWQSRTLPAPEVQPARHTDSSRITPDAWTPPGLQNLSFPPSPRAPPKV